ncbi:MAG: glycosyltransferase [Candidatus Thiodiazotropha sp.]
MEVIFIISVFFAVYSYFIYPAILMLIPKRAHTDSESSSASLPSVSLIITAHNEEGRIESKLLNSLELDYPSDKLEIIVASDCSTDRTDEIVSAYSEKGVLLVRADERKGKEYAQLCAIKASTGTILVFSDVATIIQTNSLLDLVGIFADPSIGAVSSVDNFVTPDNQIVGEGAYVKYEMWLRELESEHAGLIGLSGSFFAARKSICTEWDILSPSDFNTALNCAKNSLVAVSSKKIIGTYKDVKDEKAEYNRKIRTVIRGITAISRHTTVLNPLNFGLFSFQIWSHKLMRWAVPWFLLLCFVTNLTLLNSGLFFKLTMLIQVLFYLTSIIGALLPKSRESQIVRIVYYFVRTNIALAHALVLFIFGKRIQVWSPSKR